MLVCAIWLAMSYSSGAGSRSRCSRSLLRLLPAGADGGDLAGRPLTGGGASGLRAPSCCCLPGDRADRAGRRQPLILFAAMFALLALIAWRALAKRESGLYFIAAFFALAAEASWSATFLTPERLGAAICLCGVRRVLSRCAAHQPAARTRARAGMGAGAVLIASLVLLLFLAAGDGAASSVGPPLLLAILDAACSSRAPPATCRGCRRWARCFRGWCSASGGTRPRPSWVLPSLLALIGLTLIMLGGHAWAHAQLRRRIGEAAAATTGGSATASTWRSSATSSSSTSPRIRTGPRRRGRCSARWPC